jgi:ABC-2 type transport system permease protein
MSRLIHSEVRKLLSVRATYGFVAGAALLALLSVLGSGSGQTAADLALPLSEQQGWFFTSLLTRVVFVVLGVRIVTEELRYRTITPSLLATPARGRLLAAKAVTAAGAGVVLAVVAQLTLLAAATLLWTAAGATLHVGAADVAAMAGMAGGAALYGVLGVGIGAVVRSSVVATVGAVVWLMLVEDVLRLRIGEAVDYLPGHAGILLASAPDGATAAQAAGGATLLGWAVLATVLGAVLLRQRDVS